MKLKSSYFWLLILLILALRLCSALLYLDYYGDLYNRVLYSADDCTRGATAAIFLQSPTLFPSDQFLPFHIYILAAGIGVFGSIYLGGQVVNIILGLLFSLVVLLVVRRIWTVRIGAWSAALVSMESYVLWMTLTPGLSDICYYLTSWATILFLVISRKKPAYLWWAAVTATCGAATRYEGWAVVIAFIIVAWLWHAQKSKMRLRLVLVSLLALSFPILWLGEAFITYGDVMYRIKIFTEAMQRDSAHYLSSDFLDRSTLMLRWIFIDNPLVAVLFPLSLLWLGLRKHIDSTILGFLIFPLVILGFITYSTIRAGGGFFPDKYAAQLIPYLIPIIIAAVIDCGIILRSKGIHPAGALLGLTVVAFLAHDTMTCETYCKGVGMERNVIWAGVRMADLFNSDAIPADCPVFYEAGTEGFGLQMFCEHPERLRAVWNEAQSAEDMLSILKKRSEGAMVVFTPTLASRLEQIIANDRDFVSVRLGGGEPQGLMVLYKARRTVEYQLTYKDNDSGKEINRKVTLTFSNPSQVELAEPEKYTTRVLPVEELRLSDILSVAKLNQVTNPLRIKVNHYAGIENRRLIQKLELLIAPQGLVFLPGMQGGWERRSQGGSTSNLHNNRKMILFNQAFDWESQATYFMRPGKAFSLDIDANQRTILGAYAASVITVELWDMAYALRPLVRYGYQISNPAFNPDEHHWLIGVKFLDHIAFSPGWRLMHFDPRQTDPDTIRSFADRIDVCAVSYNLFGGAPDDIGVLEVAPIVINRLERNISDDN